MLSQYFSPDFIISEGMGGAELKGPKIYKALVNTKRLRPWGSTRGYLSSPLCLIDFHGQMDSSSPLSGVYCILCQLKGVSQCLPPLFSILLQFSTILLTSFKAKRNLKHYLNSKAHFSISVAEVCSGVWFCNDLEIPLSTVPKDMMRAFIHSTTVC